MRNLSVEEKFNERKFIITSIIRLLSFVDFSNEELSNMRLTSNKLRSIECDGGCISEDGLFMLYDQTCIEGDDEC